MASAASSVCLRDLSRQSHHIVFPNQPDGLYRHQFGIARAYAPGRPDLLLAIHGERLSLWNYAGDGDADLLDAWAED